MQLFNNFDSLLFRV